MTQAKQIERASETPVRFHTVSAIVRGGLCGHIWMPNAKCGMDFTDDLHARFNRFSDKSGATFRDALLSAQNEKGGDFRNPSFTADTVLIIKRARTIKPNHYETRIREIAVSELPYCGDLVDTETYSYDFNGEE
jgi:hypothetical protein